MRAESPVNLDRLGQVQAGRGDGERQSALRRQHAKHRRYLHPADPGAERQTDQQQGAPLVDLIIGGQHLFHGLQRMAFILGPFGPEN